MAGVQGGLRELTRRAVRVEIAEKAMELFLEQGFEETTIEQIAAAVGTSGRNVFRYFASKEEMVLGEMLERGNAVAVALQARPPAEGPWEALRNAFDECLTNNRDDGGKALARATMLESTPYLRAASLFKSDQWVELYPHLLPHVAGAAATRELRARAIVSAALACLNVAVDAWTASGGRKRLDVLLAAAFTAVTNCAST